MGISKLPTGIEIHGAAIRIVFSYRGQRCREVLKGVEPTKANIKFAANKRASILHEIAVGVFDYASHFPNSRNADLYSKSQSHARTVDEALNAWLSTKKSKVAKSTIDSYKSKANHHIRPAFGKRYIHTITKTEIDTWIAVDLQHLKNKTINELMIILRGIMKDAKADRIIAESPTDLIENLTVLTEEPDPFTRSEIDKILSTPTKRIPEINMMKFAFWSGLRVSELIALCWEDVDLSRGIVKVQRANVKGYYKVPKTKGSVREVELLAPALEAIKKAMAESYALPPIEWEITQTDNRTVKKESLRPIFVNYRTRNPHANDGSVRDRFWSAHLRKAKIRYRGPNHARHTYASQLLSSGTISKDWIALQMGHTSTKMLDLHYGKWIPEDAPPMADIVNKLLGFSVEMPQGRPKEVTKTS